MDILLTDEPIWEVDIEELIAATRQYRDLCNSRHFYENIRGFPFTPKVLPPGVTRLWVKPHVAEPTLGAEADTQDYVHTEITKRGPPTSEGLYAPKVFDYAEFEIEGMDYSCIIMEFVTGTPISSIMKPTLRSRDMSESAKAEIVRPFKDRVADALLKCVSSYLSRRWPILPRPLSMAAESRTLYSVGTTLTGHATSIPWNSFRSGSIKRMKRYVQNELPQNFD